MLTITIPFLPPRALSPNVRSHFMVKNKAVQEFKNDCYLCALQAISEQCPDWQTPERARADVTFIVPDKRRRDLDNFLGSIKPLWDAFKAAGVIKDDSYRNFSLGKVEMVYQQGKREILVVVQGERGGKS